MVLQNSGTHDDSTRTRGVFRAGSAQLGPLSYMTKTLFASGEETKFLGRKATGQVGWGQASLRLPLPPVCVQPAAAQAGWGQLPPNGNFPHAEAQDQARWSQSIQLSSCE